MSDTEPSERQPAGVVLSALVVGGLFLLLLEIGWNLGHRRFELVELPAPSYLAALTAMTIGMWLIHALPVWGLYRAGRRWVAKSTIILPGFAAIFGVSWQQTVIQGDGIGAHPLFPVIRVAFLIGVPLICAALIWAFITPRIPKLYRQIAAAIFVLVGVVFNLLILVDYQAFHGHLAAFNAAIIVGLMRPLWNRDGLRYAAVAVGLAVVVCMAAIIPSHEDHRTHVQRFGHLSASLSAGLPVGSVLRVEPDKIFDVERASHQELDEYFDVFFGDTSKFEESKPQGDNVVLVVLESVRSDYWDDPELTPEFHDWKQQGVYFPNAVANYPATPLAYGAIFTAQPPSVLAQTPYWGDHRLFDGVEDQFDELIFSRPDISWFEHTAITDFFLPREHPVNAHEHGPDGLDYLRRNISDLDDGDRFFSWVHLYEPHDPYEPREPWAEDGADDHDAYRSEIAYTDHHLGEFMDWFYEQPVAEDTLVIVVSDHGQGMGEEIMGEPFWGHHVHVHNVVSTIPMFVAGPGLPGDTRQQESPAMQLDVMPTIYDFTGNAMPAELMPQGNSMYHLIEDEPTRPLVTEAFSIRGHQFFEFVAGTQQGEDLDELRRQFHEISTDGHGYSPKLAIQHGDYKLIRDRLLETDWMYNIADDPEERRDLIDDNPDKTRQMLNRLEQWNTLQGEIVRRLDAVLAEP